MKILLINPCLRPSSPKRILPVGLACIATALDRAGFDADILDIDLHRFGDDEIVKALSEHDYDVVGLGTIVSSYSIVKKLCRQVKEVLPKTFLVVGNTVATSIPDLLLSCIPEVDAAVLGEGDETIVDIVSCMVENRPWQLVPGVAFRNEGKTILSERRPPIRQIVDIPFPRYELFDIEKYLQASHLVVSDAVPLPSSDVRTLPVNTARGCPFNCTFCSHAFKGHGYRYYPFKNVIEFFKELRLAHGVNYLSFWDELTLMSRRRTEELCTAIESANEHFYWPISPRGDLFSEKDTDLLKRCKDLGAVSIGGALESASPTILRAMNKTPHPDDYAERFIEQMRTARKVGLRIQTSLVFGYPQETQETIAATLEVCRQAGVYPSAGFLLPLPMSPMYTYSRDHGLIPDEEAYLLAIEDRQDLHLNLTQMSDRELVDTVTSGLVDLKRDLGVYLGDDQVLKTETYRSAGRETNSGE